MPTGSPGRALSTFALRLSVEGGVLQVNARLPLRRAMRVTGLILAALASLGGILTVVKLLIAAGMLKP